MLPTLQQPPQPGPKSLTQITFSEHLYRRLLMLYPSRFRQEYGREMALVFRSQCRRARQQPGADALAHLWFMTLTDLAASAITERMKEGFTMSRTLWVQLCGFCAILGGLLGLYLGVQGTNEYGNYGWDGDLAPVAGILLAIGFVGWFVAYQEFFGTRGWWGFWICLIGLVGMAFGYLFENILWPLIFIGPAMLVPIGGVMLGIHVARLTTLPAWWRAFPWIIAAIGMLAFGLEAWEDLVLHYPTLDRGVQTAQLLFSALWLGLGVGLWFITKRSPAQPPAL